MADKAWERMPSGVGYALVALGLWSSLATLGARLAHIPPFLLLAVTLFTGSLFGLRGLREWFRDWRVLAFGTAGIFGYHFLLFVALRLAPPIEANLLNYLWPVLIVLFTPLLLRGYPLRARHVVGGLTAFGGAAIIVSGGASGGRVQFRLEHWQGHALAVGAALIWSLYSVLSKRLPRVPSATVGGFCFFSAMLGFVSHLWLEPRVALAAFDWAMLLALGIGPMGLAFYAWDRALKLGDPRVVGALSYLTPLFSTVLLALSGGGQLTSPVLAGMALILGGALLGSRGDC